MGLAVFVRTDSNNRLLPQFAVVGTDGLLSIFAVWPDFDPCFVNFLSPGAWGKLTLTNFTFDLLFDWVVWRQIVMIAGEMKSTSGSSKRMK